MKKIICLILSISIVFCSPYSAYDVFAKSFAKNIEKIDPALQSTLKAVPDDSKISVLIWQKEVDINQVEASAEKASGILKQEIYDSAVSSQIGFYTSSAKTTVLDSIVSDKKTASYIQAKRDSYYSLQWASNYELVNRLSINSAKEFMCANILLALLQSFQKNRYTIFLYVKLFR